MKKIACLLLAFLLCMALTVPVLAEEPITITLQPQNTQYENYGYAVYRVKAEGSNLRAFWYMEYQGKTYNLSDNTNGIEPWEAYAGESYGAVQEDANTFTFVFGGIEEELDGAEIWCVVEDGHFDIVSQRAIITVQGDAEPPGDPAGPCPGDCEQGRAGGYPLRCKSTGGLPAGVYLV